MKMAVLPTLDQGVRSALQLYDHSDRSEFGEAVKGILSTRCGRRAAMPIRARSFQLAAGSMHSDTQLKESNPGHNAYVADELVALSWRYKVRRGK